MANIDDIIQRIIVEVIDKTSGPIKQINQSAGQASATFQQLGQQLGQSFVPATAAFQKFGQVTATSFADATRSIALLGETAPQALSNAAAAAQRFGATAQQLSQVESTIKSLAARGRDTSNTFTEMATAFDKTRGVIAQTAVAAGQVSQSTLQAAAAIAQTATAAGKAATTGAGTFQSAFTAAFASVSNYAKSFGQQVAQAFGGNYTQAITAATVATNQHGQALQQTAVHAASTHQQIRALQAVLREVGAGTELSGLLHVAGLLSFAFSGPTLAVAALVIALGAAAKAAIDAAKEAQSLADAADRAGVSFTRLSQQAEALRKFGAPIADTVKAVDDLARKISSAMPSIVEALARGADKIRTAQLNVQSALLQIAQTKLDMSNLLLQREQIQLQGEQLRLQAQTFDNQRAQLQLQGSQLANNLAGIRLQLQYSGQLNSLARQQATLTTQDAAANLRILLLKKQLRDGQISEEEFAEKMAEEEDRALNRAIKKAKVDLEQAQIAEKMLPAQQEQAQRALELQERQLKLQQEMLPIQQAMIDLAQRQNDLDQRKNANELLQNQLDIQKNLIQQERDLIALRQAEFDLQKAQANDLRKIMKEVQDAIAEGRKPKFDPLTTDATKNQAMLAVLDDIIKRTGDWGTAVEAVKKAMGTVEFDKLGLPQSVVDAFSNIARDGTTIAEQTKAIADAHGGFSEDDLTRLQGVTREFNAMKDAAANLWTEFGKANTSTAIESLKALQTTLKETQGVAEGVLAVLNKLGAFKPQPMSVKDFFVGGPNMFGDFTTWLRDSMKSLPKTLLDAIFPPAGASELKDNIKKPIEDAVKEASQVDTSKIAKAFDGISEAIGKQFDDIVKKATDAARGIVDAFSDIAQKIAEKFSGGDFSRLFDSIVESARRCVEQIVEAFTGISQRIAEQFGGANADVFSKLVEQAREAATQIIIAFRGLGDKIRESLGSVDLSEAASGIQEFVNTATQALAVFNQMLEATRQSLGAFAQAIASAFSGVGEAIAQSLIQPLQAVQQAIADIANAIVQVIRDAMERLRQIVTETVDYIIAEVRRALVAIRQAQAAAGRGGGGGGGFGGGGGGGGGGLTNYGDVAAASGGLFRGRPGRDTNMAWLSDYEYIMRPEAVQRYGVAFMHMINSLQFPGFRMGGLVMPQMRAAGIPAFAAGGVNRSSGRTLNLTIGGQTFRNLSAPEETARQLERAAISRQASSTGVKPRWTR